MREFLERLEDEVWEIMRLARDGEMLAAEETAESVMVMVRNAIKHHPDSCEPTHLGSPTTRQ